MAVAIRCQHGAFFPPPRALELLAQIDTEPMPNAQLASLVGKGAGRRGEIAGDLSRPQDDRPRKRVKVTIFSVQ
eukprot:scaffold31046_cov54-Phaeocystis_antarctica.AAC.2